MNFYIDHCVYLMQTSLPYSMQTVLYVFSGSNRVFLTRCLSSCYFSHSAAIPELGNLQLHPQNETNSDLVMNAEVMDETLTPEVTVAIWQLWQDDAIKICVSRSREFQLNDSAS